MVSVAERNAAFNAVKPVLLQNIPAMFAYYITDALILKFVDIALAAAEKYRNAHPG